MSLSEDRPLQRGALHTTPSRLLALSACLTALSFAPAAAALEGSEGEAREASETVVITGRYEGVRERRPTTTETKTAAAIQETVNVVNAEDSLRYFPNVFVRKRHIGDTQAPITTRTSGVGASARSLIYADGVLLSALIGNNNSNASPKWGMISPDAIAQVDVLYGPFSAAYAGNSIGAVVEITTRMPEKLEGQINLVGSQQQFKQYATDDVFGAGQIGAAIGDRFGPLSFWLGAQRTVSDSHPLTYITATRPASPSATGTPLTGAFADLNRAGAPIVVLGAGGLEHQVQDNLTAKLDWDISPHTDIAYTIGRFGNDTDSHVESYLRNGAGATVYSGGPFNIGGYSFSSIAASAFSNGVYHFEEEQWMQSLALTHSTGGAFDWRIVATDYDYAKSEQRTPSTALPAAQTGGVGSIARMNGTGWRTLDFKGVYRPQGAEGAHEISFGAHGDEYELANNRYNTANWISGAAGALASAARGKTQTEALWVQDFWRIAPDVRITSGVRWENWKASEGLNYSLSPALNTAQPELSAEKASPKASIEWDFASDWRTRASIGQAYRFPTVGELYQAITTGATLTVPNPNLRPERALSTEWSVERHLDKGKIRLTAFTEDLDDALISQTAPLVSGSTTLYNYVQNIDKVRSRGVELVAERDDTFIHGLSLSGSVTYVESEIKADAAFPAAVGKHTPQVPEWRATAVATYRPNEHWAYTLAGRYSDRVYATIDNSDPVTHTYQGFDDYLVFDARVNYAIDDHWTAAVGIENLGNEDYFLFHPFPQRTATAELKYQF